MSIGSPVFYVLSLVSAIHKCDPALQRLKAPLPAHAIFGSFSPGSFYVDVYNVWPGATYELAAWCPV